ISPKSNDLKEIIPKYHESSPIPEIQNPFFKAKYNQINLEVALGLLEPLNLRYEASDLEKLNPPEGRFNIFQHKDNFYIIDFAHTPDALENLLVSVKESFPSYKRVVVFGCGGDRDRTKRAPMGRAAAENSEFTIVTSDNPRF